MEQDVKQVRHRCGYVFFSRPLNYFEGTGGLPTIDFLPAVVVQYRDEHGHVVFQCPRCKKPLQLWWDVLNPQDQQRLRHLGFYEQSDGFM
ncbi:hypothetical protein EI42_06138 [Thermosporothrix hazakensis]|jgi:hypothetical protein|uniref:Uncharacterized protein n=1 Tax=Thermosporothrix hazakensis TaxID=644383 RepID=A0A326TTT5_THEHA|nr:hypothetical protein [Thermosporothrix hazakensis]PZW19325.1 hypothetical protein EI42_06138 [Thermosporothrix hazakensis]GCE48236.1 hypothetical protein KTH_31050 [Thermosporothrix hazakensis]